MTKADLARQYRDKHPDMPTLKLARIVYKDNPIMFKNVEDARDKIRAIEGKKGKSNNHKETHKCEHRPVNPYKLPESDESKFEPFTLKATKVAVLSDIHVPYHSIEALTACINYLKQYQPDCLLINGDFFDFYGLSRYLKDPRKRNFAEEIRLGCELLTILKKEVCENIILKLGNHDERYEHFLWMKAGEIMGLEEFTLKDIIEKRAGKVQIVSGKRVIKAGKLNIVHGHEFGGSVFSPVNIARGFYLRAKSSTMGGHHHRTSEHVEPNLNQDIVTTWSTGCLCELHPEYLPINNWNHGFATVDIFKDGSYHVKNIRIYKGQIL